jgi:hypothetical protein
MVHQVVYKVLHHLLGEDLSLENFFRTNDFFVNTIKDILEVLYLGVNLFVDYLPLFLFILVFLFQICNLVLDNLPLV